MSSDFSIHSDIEEGTRAGKLPFSDKSSSSSIYPMPIQKFQSDGDKTPGLKPKARSSKKLYMGSHKERLEKFNRKREEKTSKLSEESQRLELRECTFTPKVNSPHTRRSVDQFIKDQSDFAAKLKNKLDALIDKNNKLPSDVSFAPRINEASQRIAMMNRSKDKASCTLINHTKTNPFYNSQSRMPQHKPIPKHKPHIGNSFTNPKLMNKKEPIPYTSNRHSNLKQQFSSQIKDKNLPHDDRDMQFSENCERSMAKKTTNHTIENVPTSHDSKKSFTPNTSKGKSPISSPNRSTRKSSINQKSIKMLSASFILEFNRVFCKLSSKSELTYSMYIELLSQMSFILKTSDKEYALTSWNALSSSKAFVPKKKLLSFLLKVMNFKQGKQHKQYFQLYNNRINSTLRSSINPSSPQSESFSFRPQLSERSIQLAHIQKAKRTQDFLYKERQNLKQKFNKMKNQKLQKELDECSFKPEINTLKTTKSTESITDCWGNLTKNRRQSVHRALALYSLSMEKEQRIQRKRKEAQDDEIIKTNIECPFSPKVRSHVLKDKKLVPDNKGIAQAVNRITHARQQRTTKKAQLTRGYTFTETSQSFKFDMPITKQPPPLLKRSNTKLFRDFSPKMIDLSESSSDFSDFD